jgi:protein transport protein SEC39
MSLVLSPPKLVLLAVRLATSADIDAFAFLIAQHGSILRRDLVLRILLTYLPETVKSSRYVPLVQQLATSGDVTSAEPVEPDYGDLEALPEAEASKKVRKLHLLPLAWKDAPFDCEDDPITLFLLRRAHRVDEEAGLLTQLPDLIFPFAHHAPGISTWIESTLLPLLRRNYEYYPQAAIPHTLAEFHDLSDQAAVAFLLSNTGAQEQDYPFVGRDLRGLIGPWLFGKLRQMQGAGGPSSPAKKTSHSAWEAVLEWLTFQASKNWKVAVQAVEQWDGPSDFDLGDFADLWLEESEQEQLEHRYARAALAAAYSIAEAAVDALSGSHQIVLKIKTLLDHGHGMSLQDAASTLPAVSELANHELLSPSSAAHMRKDLLAESNPLTSPAGAAPQLLNALIISAFILTRAGSPCSVKRAGDLVFLQDEREQKSEATKLIHSIARKAPKNDDQYWTRAREEILWLGTWGVGDSATSSNASVAGLFGKVKKDFLEIEILKAFLANMRKFSDVIVSFMAMT